MALTITAALVIGTLGAAAPATAAPAAATTATALATATTPDTAAPVTTVVAPAVAAVPKLSTLTGTVSGHTTTGTKPLAGVFVRAYTATSSVHGYTDATGKYSIAGLTAGSYKVSYNNYDTSAGFVFAEQYWKNQTNEAQATPIKVGATNLSGYNVTLQQGSTISGILTAKVGTKGVPATTVRKVTTYLNGSKTGVDHYIGVDWAGRYNLTGLVAGTYKLSFGVIGATTGLKGEYYNNATTLAASKSIVLGFAKTVTGIDAELAGKPEVNVSGSVYGSTTVGYTLTVSAYFDPAADTSTYQWYRNGVAISGATKTTYALVGADAGKTISVTAKGSKAGYTSASASFSAWSTITPGTFSANQPTISGTAKVGATLTATPGSTIPKPTAVTYTWFRSGALISGATAKTYKITAADAGFTLSVRATAKSTGYTTLTRGSSSTVRVPKP
ncbi:hypothetical protein BJQ94_02845 [Cryobacterium sp. SO2]|uniref:hypothetical protein n=1 Tax=Cryobacterium sp. SO2 TaxID=1897060 RepID=UPI00223DDFF8|nr:hypothetical protein [Cryobacterium sp. SO2]WEO77995.1 hypothetical protein BJQ94_02845 [Cryobacterium sp. SO2]